MQAYRSNIVVLLDSINTRQLRHFKRMFPDAAISTFGRL
nr:MAG TPA: hypothetical protein [Caudoviricetes sp.]